MARTKKYKTIDDVVLDLATGADRKDVMRIKYRFSNKDPLYANMIQSGIEKYDKLSKVKEARESYLLPEDYLSRQELEEMVGWRGIGEGE